MKKIITLFLIIGIIGLSVPVFAQVGGGVSPANLWRLVGNQFVRFINSNWQLGSSAERISKGWFSDLDSNTARIGTLNISSMALSPLVVSGSATTTIRGDGATSTFGGAVSAIRLVSTGLTGGSVLFSGTAGIISQDNANLFWDNTNKRLGIGTASPASRLVVRGSGTGSGTSGLNVTNSAGTSALFVRDDGNVGIGTTTPAYRLDVVGTSRFSATSTFSGNVGIGTTSPTERLHVVGNIRATQDVYISTSTRGIILTSPNGACWRVTVNDTGALATTNITCP